MRKLFILFNLLVLVLLISSCGDILNPEPDTHTTKIKYHSVLKDQEHSVIMPLKVGNIWVYKVTELNGDGSVNEITYDTTIVKKDTLLNGEKWFLVSDPNSKACSDPLLLTNTDKGLYSNFLGCDCSLLRAEYPVKHQSYLYCSDEYPTEVRIYEEYGKLSEGKIVWVLSSFWIGIEKINDYLIFNNTSVCYKYKMNAEVKTDGKKVYVKEYPADIEYFVPNLGLVRKEYCTADTAKKLKMSRLRELIYTNVKI
ncbi:MAG: hypothetical protein WCR42_04960 [bacterium]